MQAGYRLRWVDGYLEEQSTQAVGDFVRQRRRWFQGLMKVALHAPVKLRWRFSIGFRTAAWALAPLTLIYTICHFFYGFQVRGWVMFLANVSVASSASIYLMGLRANLDEHGITGRLARLRWYITQLVLWPVFTTMETVGALAAILKPVKGFHVVQK